MLPQSRPRPELLLNSEITPTGEAAAIFAIVARNLLLPQWNDLIPEAQLQIIEEAVLLLQSSYLSIDQKQALLFSLCDLQNHISSSQSECSPATIAA